MRDLVALSDDWWFVVHNADLLAKLDPENDELSQLRDTFILNYAEAMLGDKVILLFYYCFLFLTISERVSWWYQEDKDRL